MKIYPKILWVGLLAAFLASCSSGGDEVVTPPQPQQIPIKLTCGIETRVTDNAYESGDKIGLYVVNYNEGSPGTLQPNGNHADNVAFTYNGTWNAATPLYWKDDETPADFYCYYPYGSPSDLEAHSFRIREDQSTTEAYKASEFLYGKASRIMPTESAVSISTKHLLSCALIKIEAGNGFTAESLAAAAVSVKMNGLLTEAVINLKSGSIRASGTVASIVPLKESELNYKALVVPQEASADDLITVTVDGREFRLQKTATFESGKRHTFTVTVSKTSNGINVGITGWEDDDIDQGGTAE